MANSDQESWSSEALTNKAQLYLEEMHNHGSDTWQYGLFSGLALELLARAALSKISPVLLADPKDWNNVYSALGYSPTAKQFSPRSIAISEVFERIRSINPDLDTELERASISHIHRRNAELHSGVQTFSGLSANSWLPNYYRVCEVLAKMLDLSLEALFGDETAKVALKLIEADKDKGAKAVSSLIAAHKTVWEQKTPTEKEKLQLQAGVWATKQEGHRVECPSCGSQSLVQGEPIAPAKKSIKDDIITEKQEHLPSKFECIACGLRISGLSQLAAAGLADSYTSTQSYDASAYYGPEDYDSDEDSQDYWEDDNNDPY